jgi:hypothetical protein
VRYSLTENFFFSRISFARFPYIPLVLRFKTSNIQ